MVNLKIQSKKMDSPNSEKTKMYPPIVRRDEGRVIYAGAAPSDWPAEFPRQSESSKETLINPPIAIPDPYGWLRDDQREDSSVLAHLKAENEYTEQITGHLGELRNTLYNEFLSTIQETDYTVPLPKGKYYTYQRTFEGKSFPVYCRAPMTPLFNGVEWDGKAESPILPGEEVILDVNSLAKQIGTDYCEIGECELSPSKSMLAYTVDTTGDEKYQLFIKNLDTGEIVFEDESLETNGCICWGYDDLDLFYLKMDNTQRPFQVWRKRLSSVPQKDEMVKEEMDPLFRLCVHKSRDEEILFYSSESGETSECWFLNLKEEWNNNQLLDKPLVTTRLQCISERRFKVMYDVEHRNGWWWILAKIGDETPNKTLYTAPALSHQQEWTLVSMNGEPLFDGGVQRAVNHIRVSAKHIFARGREEGVPKVWISEVDEQVQISSFVPLTFDEDIYDVGLSSHEYNTDHIKVYYESLVTPLSYINILLSDLTTRKVVKMQNVPGYNKHDFECQRFFVTSRDGTTSIPVLMVYSKSVMEEHQKTSNPVLTHLYGYGSYGICMESDFDISRLPLLNRGIVYVVAQIRGGGEMGLQWFEEPMGAKYLCKKNTFNDFVDIASHLIHIKKLTTSKLLSIEGRSAGGMLIGACINQAPHLFKAAILGVPFVDVVATMIDSRIPLTTNEWEEWGNPNEEKYFQYMMEYCPMQNVKHGATYPSCLLTCGLNDSRVPYWEAAKFAATLRHKQCAQSGPVCLKVELSAGHFSASDRYKYFRELAFDYAFLLDQMNLSDLEKKVKVI